MTFADEIDDRKSRCRQHLQRLRVLALSPDDAAASLDVTAEIRDATNAVIAEAEAMSHLAIRAGGERDPQAPRTACVQYPASVFMSGGDRLAKGLYLTSSRQAPTPAT